MSEAIENKKENEEFRQTQLGPRTVVVPENWRRLRIKDIATTVTRGKQPTYVENPGIPVLNQSCVYWDGYHPENLKYLDEDVSNDWKDKYFAQNGDVLINSTGQGTLGRALYWDRESGTHAIDSHITRVEVDSEVVNPEFLRYYLESTWGQTMLYVYCVAGSTGQIELSKTNLMSMPLLVPSLPEQRRIANILSTVDNQIQQINDTLNKQKSLKYDVFDDVLQNGFGSEDTSKLKFGPKYIGIPQNWDVKRIRNVVSDENGAIRTGPFGSKLKNEHHVSEGVKLYEQRHVYNDNFKMGDRHVTEDWYESELTSYEAKPRDVLITLQGTVGEAAMIPEHAETGVINPKLIRIRVDDSVVDPQYLANFLDDSQIANDQIKSLSHGAVVSGLNVKTVGQIKIPIPSLSEQNKIIQLIGILQEKIDIEYTYKQNLQELKRGLMQELLTGKKRVDPEQA